MAAAAIEKKKPVFTKVDQLRPDTSGHNLTVKVKELTPHPQDQRAIGPALKRAGLTVKDALQVLDAKLVLDRPARPGGKPQRIAECTVVDLMKSGNFVIVRNAKIDMFRGSMRLAVNQWGKIEAAAEGTSFTPKTDNNLSLVEYELVQVPSASDHS
ncbi:hypothetical protein N2152v2_010055 [Parachlorella kessleri]